MLVLTFSVNQINNESQIQIIIRRLFGKYKMETVEISLVLLMAHVLSLMHPFPLESPPVLFFTGWIVPKHSHFPFSFLSFFAEKYVF